MEAVSLNPNSGSEYPETGDEAWIGKCSRAFALCSISSRHGNPCVASGVTSLMNPITKPPTTASFNASVAEIPRKRKGSDSDNQDTAEVDGDPQKRICQLEGTYNDHLVQVPDHFRAAQKLKHVVKGIIQMPLKHWHTSDIDHLSRKPVPVFDHPLSKEMLPNVQSKPPLVQL
ncbi:aryl hydrocarbon receptor nuclear translocator-like protein 2 isoform x1 [Limosa lapponica baueri]|uniref:Aryl hydrocarbon receptor nuclear translocator-like protein 2 isoform x1 n=1 Tax=Limosa lapponica baueri TaxID=1758121 RepID=A0A2I0TQU7_LIMLA|nr:aryl hydrocarbon receptor nuclear translocator-like protein 2 isoform x1 [Limosa lapponica baueri]